MKLEITMAASRQLSVMQFRKRRRRHRNRSHTKSNIPIHSSIRRTLQIVRRCQQQQSQLHRMQRKVLPLSKHFSQCFCVIGVLHCMHFTMACYTVLYRAVLAMSCSAVLCHAVLWHAALCRAELCHIVLCCAVLYHACRAVPCCAVPCCGMPCHAVPCHAMLCCAMLDTPVPRCAPMLLISLLLSLVA